METNNQRDKEETFIQNSRKGGKGQPGWRGLVERWWLEDWGGQTPAGGAGGPTFVCR